MRKKKEIVQVHFHFQSMLLFRAQTTHRLHCCAGVSLERSSGGSCLFADQPPPAKSCEVSVPPAALDPTAEAGNAAMDLRFPTARGVLKSSPGASSPAAPTDDAPPAPGTDTESLEPAPAPDVAQPAASPLAVLSPSRVERACARMAKPPAAPTAAGLVVAVPESAEPVPAPEVAPLTQEEAPLVAQATLPFSCALRHSTERLDTVELRVVIQR